MQSLLLGTSKISGKKKSKLPILLNQNYQLFIVEVKLERRTNVNNKSWFKKKSFILYFLRRYEQKIVLKM